jgi:hypothetical protein
MCGKLASSPIAFVSQATSTPTSAPATHHALAAADVGRLLVGKGGSGCLGAPIISGVRERRPQGQQSAALAALQRKRLHSAAAR